MDTSGERKHLLKPSDKLRASFLSIDYKKSLGDYG